MSKKKYFSSYKSPNIHIVPNASICYPPSPKRPKLKIPIRDKSPQNVDVSFLDDFDVDEIVKCLNDCDNNALNTTSQKDIENNDRLENDCPKSSFETINDNERNNIIEKDLATERICNEEIKVTENNHRNMNTSTSKEVKTASNNCNENQYLEGHINEDNTEMVVSSPFIETYNTLSDTIPSMINDSEVITNHLENLTENNNIKELINEKSIDKCFLQTDKNFASSDEASKPSDEDSIRSNTIIKCVDKIDCSEKKYLLLSNDSDLQDKHNTTQIVNVDKIINKFHTNEISENKQLHNTHDVSESLETENLKIIDREKKTDTKTIVLTENVDKSQPDLLIFDNLGNRMFQCLLKKYSMFSLLHSGKYSNILKCKGSEGEHYAVKMLKKKCNGSRQENMLSRLRGDIPKESLLCVYLIAGFSFNNNWCYLTEYYPKNLKDVLLESKKNLHIDTIQVLAGQLVGAVTTLRNKNIVHSDINPRHILLDHTNSKLRICGFDVAYYIENATLFPYKGSKCYRAPEVILGHSAGFSLDVWSTALVLHEMATGIQLFGRCIADQVLYKQMCFFGDVPPQMLQRSLYRNKYIIGYCFQKDKCLRHTHNYMLKGKNKIACTIHGAYYSHWTAGKNKKQISKDMQKISQLIKLLDQMLVINPEHRLPIEFACSNPFIYKIFHS